MITKEQYKKHLLKNENIYEPDSPKLPVHKIVIQTFPDYAIIYEDPDRPIEIFTDVNIANRRLQVIKYNWNCHLFKRVKSV